MRIAELIGSQLTWNQPSVWKSIYRMYAGGEQIAVMSYEGVLQTRGRIESEDGCWTFRQQGFWARNVNFSICGSEQVVAVYERSFWKGGGVFVLPYEHRLNARMNLWNGDIFISQPGSEQVLIHFRRPSAWRASGICTLEPAAERISALPLVMYLTWYAQVQSIRDQMAAAA